MRYSILNSSLQAVTNFVMYKFGSLKQAEWQTMYDLAKMFLYCFNHWKLETPSIHARSCPADDQRAYKENHARYYYVCRNLHVITIHLPLVPLNYMYIIMQLHFTINFCQAHALFLTNVVLTLDKIFFEYVHVYKLCTCTCIYISLFPWWSQTLLSLLMLLDFLDN